MFGIRYFKTPPTTHVIQYRGGRIVRQGAGASFFYFAPTTTLVSVPLASVDVPFVFQEVTADFQEVTLQGQLTYRVADPVKLVAIDGLHHRCAAAATSVTIRRSSTID